MRFSKGDRVEWADGHNDRGTVLDVQGPDKKRSRGSHEARVRVRWDSGAIGWISGQTLSYLDVVTRLGDLVRGD